jgi:O-antigen/teichoic acid export membrane protein
LPVKAPDPRWFPEALRSVLAQSVRDLEVIVIEDPSSVSAEPMLQEFEDPRIRYVKQERPSSLVERLNLGLGLARAPLVARMDADDVCEPDRLEKQLAFLDANADVDVVGTDLTIIDENGRAVGHRAYPTTHAAILEAFSRFNAVAHPAVTFRRATVEAAGGYQHPERAAQDYELWSRLAAGGRRFANLPEPLLRYRVHEGAIKSTKLRETLRSTLATKETYWRRGMSLRARARLFAERLALMLPPSLVMRAFRAFEYAPASEMGRSMRRELVHSAILGAGTVVTALFTLFYMAWAGRRLGPSEASDFYAAIFLVFLLLAATNPVSAIVARFAATDAAAGDHARVEALRRWMTRRLGAAIAVVFLLVLPFGGWLARALGFASVGPFALAGAVTALFALLQVGRGVLRGLERYDSYGLNRALEAGLRAVGGVAVLSFAVAAGTPQTASLALWPYVGAAFIALLLTERELRTNAPAPAGRVDARAVLGFSAIMMVLALADAGFENLDVLFVKATFGADASGVYGATATLTRVFGVLVTPFVVMIPTLSAVDPGRTGRAAVLRVCGYFLALATPALALVALFPDTLVHLVYGAAFAHAAPLVAPHAAGLVCGYVAMILAQALASAGRFRFVPLYVAAVVVEVAALARFGSDLEHVVWTVLWVKVVLVTALAVIWRRTA